MKSILENLNRSVGVIGSAVMTPDGMLAASAISDARDQEALAAIGSSLVLSAARSLKTLGDAALDSLLVDGSRGKIMLVNTGSAYLVVITDAALSLDSTMLDVRSAVERIQRKINLDA